MSAVLLISNESEKEAPEPQQVKGQEAEVYSRLCEKCEGWVDHPCSPDATFSEKENSQLPENKILAGRRLKQFTLEGKQKSLSHERAGRILAGLSVALTAVLGYFIHPLFFLALLGICFSLVLSGITDRCVIKNILIKIGFPGERDIGRQEIQSHYEGRKV